MSLPKLISIIITVCLLAVPIDASEDKSTAPVRRHNNSEKKIALTFDDGPSELYTEEILDILDEYRIKATFFVIGTNCERSPQIVMREIEAGHEIGNHTYTHPHLSKIGQEDLRSEMIRTEKILFELGEYRPKLFRPPEGVYSRSVSKTVENLEYIPILWTVDTMDWRAPSAEKIANTVMQNVSAGVIILCHDYVSGKSNTPAALKIFIPKLIAEGYKFCTVSELMESI